MVTKKGYQSGVQRSAAAAGIVLMLLREQSKDESPETITAIVHFRAMRYLDTEFACDEAWLVEQYQRFGL